MKKNQSRFHHLGITVRMDEASSYISALCKWLEMAGHASLIISVDIKSQRVYHSGSGVGRHFLVKNMETLQNFVSFCSEYSSYDIVEEEDQELQQATLQNEEGKSAEFTSEKEDVFDHKDCYRPTPHDCVDKISDRELLSEDFCVDQADTDILIEADRKCSENILKSADTENAGLGNVFNDQNKSNFTSDEILTTISHGDLLTEDPGIVQANTGMIEADNQNLEKMEDSESTVKTYTGNVSKYDECVDLTPDEFVTKMPHSELFTEDPCNVQTKADIIEADGQDLENVEDLESTEKTYFRDVLNHEKYDITPDKVTEADDRNLGNAESSISIEKFSLNEKSSIRRSHRQRKGKYSDIISKLKGWGKLESASSVSPVVKSCKACAKFFKTERDLQFHKKNNCSQMSSPLMFKSSRVSPVVKSSTVCAKGYKTEKDLEFHKENNCSKTSSPLMFKCKVCSETFSCLNEFVKHVQSHEQMESTVNVAVEKAQDDITRKKRNAYINSFLQELDSISENTQTMEKSNLTANALSSSAANSIQTSISQKLFHNLGPHKCKFCEKRFYYIRNLKTHEVKVHVKNYDSRKCKFCGKRFSSRSNRQTHEKIHLNQRSYLCNFCGKSYNRKGSLNSHISLRHSDNPSCICSTCGKTLKCERYLKRHIINTHLKPEDIANSGLRVFPCKVCQRMFPDNFLLEVHMNTHTGEKPFKCDICGQRFACKGGMKIHQTNLKCKQIRFKKESKELLNSSIS